MKQGRLIVLSGPSGVGKSTVAKEVMRRRPNLRFSVSVTTRERRPGEVEGESYYFVSRERFDALVRGNALLEHAEYVKECYGTPAKPVDDMLAQGLDVLLDIEPCGAFQVRARRPDAVLIFMTAPSFAALEERLRRRGDTEETVIRERLARASWEYGQARQYDYIIVNDDAGRAAAEIEAILLAEHCRTALRLDALHLDSQTDAVLGLSDHRILGG